MTEMNASVTVDLEGNLLQQAGRYGQAMEQMANRGTRQMNRMQRSTRALGNGLDRLGNRYTTFLTGGALALAGREVVALEERFARLGIQANRDRKEMELLKGEIFAVSQQPDIRIDPSQLTSAIEEIIEKTGDLDFARANIENLALAISATGAEGKSIGGITAEFQKMGIINPDAVRETLDILITQGKEGAFTLQNLAALGPRVVTAYTSMGRGGVEGIREMGAALQVIRMGTGSSEMAASAFEAVMRTLSDAKKVKLLQGAGIKVFDVDALKEGSEVLRPINELMVDIIKAADGKKTVLSSVFDAEAIRAFNSALTEYNMDGQVTSLKKFMDVQADGTQLTNDSGRAARTAAGAMRYLDSAWHQFADGNLAKPIEHLADRLNSLDPQQVQDYFEYAKLGVLALGGAIVAYKLDKLTGLSGMLKGKLGKGGAAGALGALTPTPVYVVNMPGGKGGKGKPVLKRDPYGGGFKSPKPGPKIPGKVPLKTLVNGTSLRALPALGAGAMGLAAVGVAVAGALGYAAGSLINEGFEYSDKNWDTNIQATLADTVGKAIAESLAFLGNDNAQAAVDADKRAQLTIKLEQGRLMVQQFESQDYDADISGSSMVMP